MGNSVFDSDYFDTRSEKFFDTRNEKKEKSPLSQEEVNTILRATFSKQAEFYKSAIQAVGHLSRDPYEVFFEVALKRMLDTGDFEWMFILASPQRDWMVRQYCEAVRKRRSMENEKGF